MVRPVIFLAYSGEMRWRTRAGDEITATLGTPMTKDQIAQAWRTALDPAGEWVSRVLEAADKRLTEVRRGMPDAGGLVIAGDHEDARAYAALLRGLTGKRPVVVLSDDKAASKKISSFAVSDERWMVAVRMVSEGVDIPRLAVGVYATSVSTALFFAQAVGRFVRVRQRGETALVFLPSVPVLLSYAAELEAERDHVLRSPLAETPTKTSSPRPSGSAMPRTRSASRPSSLSTRPRTSTGCCTTAGSSVPPRRPARRRKRTSSACPACWIRTRSGPCSASARTPRSPPARERRPQPPQTPPRPHRR